ncbi:MAG: HD domain-containing phosphohydrolase [Candidatus Gastranaerophilaceae bacterium]|jgi:HD-GYP domain-containing protein (c-di-GMP phosphodiesterase class II)
MPVELGNTKSIENDPIEAIFELNMGDFLTEHLISGDLLNKINTNVKDKTDGLKNQLRELISIYSIDNTLTLLGFNNEEDFVIYNSIAKTSTQMLDIDACHIFLTADNAKLLKNKNENDLILVGNSLEFDNSIFTENIGLKLSDTENIFVKAFTENRTIYIKDTNEIKNWSSSERFNKAKTKTALIVPMSSNSGKVGLICLESYAQKEILPEFINLIEITAKLFVTSMNLQKLVEETQKLLDDNSTSAMELRHLRTELTSIIADLGDEQQMFVEALADAVDAKGHYETEHSANVSKLAREICEYLQLNEKTTDLIYYAGLLQNIGKITLPEELFTKKQKLSQKDWDQLQNHPNVGVNLLMKINFLSEVIPYIHYHRERWNGGGEPEGLSGQSIPLGSRIIAAAEAYQALVTKRPYRAAIDKNEAINILTKEAGIKWDPIIIDALIQLKK